MGKLTVLCVDDEAIITESLKRELRQALPGLAVESALNGSDALKILEEIAADGGEPAVLVTDERMPGMKGHELLQQARLRYPNIYGILLTGYTDIEAIAQAVNEAGLFRYIHKPWERRDLAMAVRRAAELYAKERELETMHGKIEELNRALVAALETTTHGSDPDTYLHVQRVACYAALLGKTMGHPDELVRKLYVYAPLHDIGKAGIPHSILAKPAALTAEEFKTVKRHVELGVKFLKSIEIDPFVLDLILYHHERWDGTGYLSEASGDKIPLSARITAVADVLDAMLSKRPYKEAMPFAEAAAYIEGQAGLQFDPAVVEAFAAERDQFERISSGTAPELCREMTKVP